MACFQVKLAGSWKDFAHDDDSLLKIAFKCGHPKVWCNNRNQQYEYDFETMLQKNLTTGKIRSIRPPHRAHAPNLSEPVPPVAVIEVPPGCAGTEIVMPHPTVSGEFISVFAPVGAKDYQKMLVPVDTTVPEDELAVPVEARPTKVNCSASRRSPAFLAPCCCVLQAGVTERAPKAC